MNTPKTKHFIFVIHSIGGGGAERVVLNLAKILQSKHRVTIIAFDKTRDMEVDKNITIHTVEVQQFKTLPRSIRFRIIANKVDKFITHKLKQPNEELFVLANLTPAEFYLRRSKLNGAHIIHSTLYRNTENEVSPSSWQRKVKRAQNLYSNKPCIAVSEGVKEDMLKVLPHLSIKTIYNPVIPEALIKKASLPSDKILPESYIIHVGRFCEAKRHDLLIKAYHKSGVSTPLVLLGKGELESDLIKQIKELNLEEQVILAGFTQNPYPCIKNAKFMVLSSEYEGLPTVILESVALDTPVVSFDCPSGPSEILPAKNLAPPLDVDSLSDLIAEADQNTSAFKSKLAKEFSDSHILREYEHISSLS